MRLLEVRTIFYTATHVLHVVPTLGFGGMELAMARVIRGLVSVDMRHSIVCLKGDAVIGNLFGEDVPIYCMHSGSNDMSLPWRLWKLIRRTCPAVIHARNWSAWPDVALARLVMLPRSPLIFSFHGMDAAGVMPFRRRLASRVLASLTNHIFTVSQASRRTLVEQIGIPARRIKVIPNGVDTERFAPGPARSAGGRIVIGTVGSLTPVKNQSLLIRSVAQLISSGQDIDLRLAGNGPMKDELISLARELGIEDHVFFAGHVDDVPRFLHQLDIFALPSSSEQHPNALLEAMACGLPCAATRVGSVDEVLARGKYGIVLQSDDVSGMTDALIGLVQDINMRNCLGAAARGRVLERYTVEVMIRKYEDMYRTVSRSGRL